MARELWIQAVPCAMSKPSLILPKEIICSQSVEKCSQNFFVQSRLKYFPQGSPFLISSNEAKYIIIENMNGLQSTQTILTIPSYESKLCRIIY